MTEFPPLPGRPEPDNRETFRQCLAHLLRLLGPDADPAGHQRTEIRKALARRQPLPEEFFVPLIEAAVHDPDPSFNRQFVEPALRAFGRRRVQSALLDRLRTGTNPERAGAARAWYWTGLPKAAQDRAPDVVAAWNEAALREFVGNDLDVRRCLIPGLWLYAPAHSPELRPLVDRAVAIARAHPDDYIRHRVEHQVHG